MVGLIAPYYPEGKNGRPPFALVTMLRVHFMQQWFSLSDPAMEDVFFDTPLYREFAQLGAHGRVPDENTILRFVTGWRNTSWPTKSSHSQCAADRARHATQSWHRPDATLIPAPSSTKKKNKVRDPEMHSCKKSNQWYFGMKAHIGVDADSGIVHTVRGTSGHVGDITEGKSHAA